MYKKLILASSILVCLTGKVLCKEKIGLDLSSDIYGKYIWRGQNLDDDPIFQPAINVSYKGLTTGIWGNLELTNINYNSCVFSELDYSLNYSDKLYGIECIGYSVGVIYYDFPGIKINDTTEIYWGLNLDLPLNPSITVYHDFDEAEGSYISLAAKHSIEKIIEFTKNLAVGLDIGASLGWGSSSYNKYYWGTDQSKLQDLMFSVSFPMQINGWKVAPSLNYVTLVSDDIRDTDAYGTDSDFFYAGAGFSKSF